MNLVSYPPQNVKSLKIPSIDTNFEVFNYDAACSDTSFR